MNERAALLAAVLAAPADDMPRLVYADFLEETGDPVDAARAHFIRAEIAAERLPPEDPERERLESQAARLFNKHGDAWNRELPEWDRWYGTRLVYRRGFVEEVHTNFRRFAFGGGTLLAAVPVRYLALASRDGTLPFIDAMMASLSVPPDLSHIQTLRLGPHLRFTPAAQRRPAFQVDATDDLIALVCGYPSLTRLQTLILAGNEIDDGRAADLVRRLPESVFAGSLAELDLSDNRLTDAGAMALASANWPPGLTRLNLTGNDVGPASAAVLRERLGEGIVL